MNALSATPKIACPVEAISSPAIILAPDPILQAVQKVYEERMRLYLHTKMKAFFFPSSSSTSPLSVIASPAPSVFERVSRAAQTLSPQKEPCNPFFAMNQGSSEEDISEIELPSSSSSSASSFQMLPSHNSVSHQGLSERAARCAISAVHGRVSRAIYPLGQGPCHPAPERRLSSVYGGVPQSDLCMHSMAPFSDYSEELPIHPFAQALEEVLADGPPDIESDNETLSDDDIPLNALAKLPRKRKCLEEIAAPCKRSRILPLNTEGIESLASAAVLGRFVDERITFFKKLLSPLQDQYRENCPWRHTTLLKLMCEYSDAPLLDEQELDVLIGVLKEIKMKKYNERYLIRQCKYKGIHLRFDLKKIEARSSQYSMDVLASESFRFTETRKRAEYIQPYLTRLEADPIIGDFLRMRDEFLREAQGVKRAGK